MSELFDPGMPDARRSGGGQTQPVGAPSAAKPNGRQPDAARPGPPDRTAAARGTSSSATASFPAPGRPKAAGARFEIEMPAGADDPDADRAWKEKVHHNFRHRFVLTILRLEAMIVLGSAGLVGYAWFSLLYLPEHFNFHWTVYVGQFMCVTTMIMAGLAYFSFRVSERISRHICDATDRLHRLLEGEVPRRLVCFHDDEFHELADTVNDFIARADRNRYRTMFVDPPHSDS